MTAHAAAGFRLQLRNNDGLSAAPLMQSVAADRPRNTQSRYTQSRSGLAMETLNDMQFYKPQKPVTGPAYSPWFKLLATVISSALAAYGVSIVERFPLMQYGFMIKLVLLVSAVMLVISYYWFLRSTVTVDDKGITQTWMYNRQVEWNDVRSAKLIGIPMAGWLFPPRLVVRTGTAFMTFNGGSRAVVTEFAKISLAFQMKK